MSSGSSSSYHTAAEGSSRKRRRMSGNSGRSVVTMPLLVEAGAQLESASTTDAMPPTDVPVAPRDRSHTCHHKQVLETLHGDLESMRQLITCKICQHFLYEPYALGCGHTFCYSCLSQWTAQSHKKTCPDCRAAIKAQPTPSYLIRELVVIFISRSQLLPDGETAEEHAKQAQEEADLVAADKANADPRTGGLFKGNFRAPGVGGRALIAIRDHSDNVDRCPQCTNEVEDGFCNNCQVRVRSAHDSDVSSNYDSSIGMYDDSLSDSDSDASLGDHVARLLGSNSDFLDHSDTGSIDVYSVDSADGIGYAPDIFNHRVAFDSDGNTVTSDHDDMGDFIDDGVDPDPSELSEEHSDEDDRGSRAPSAPLTRANLNHPIVVSSDDEDGEDDNSTVYHYRASHLAARGSSPQPHVVPSQDTIHDADSGSDDEPVIQPARRRVANRRRRPLVISSDSESDSEANSNADSDSDRDALAETRNHGPIVSHQASDDESVSDAEDSTSEEDDDDNDQDENDEIPARNNTTAPRLSHNYRTTQRDAHRDTYRNQSTSVPSVIIPATGRSLAGSDHRTVPALSGSASAEPRFGMGASTAQRSGGGVTAARAVNGSNANASRRKRRRD